LILTRHAGDCRHLRNEIEQLPDLRRIALPGCELLAVKQYRQLAHTKNLALRPPRRSPGFDPPLGIRCFGYPPRFSQAIAVQRSFGRGQKDAGHRGLS